MPGEGQKTITFMEKDIPFTLTKFCEINDRSLSNTVKICMWYHFGTDEQKKIATNILGTSEGSSRS